MRWAERAARAADENGAELPAGHRTSWGVTRPGFPTIPECLQGLAQAWRQKLGGIDGVMLGRRLPDAQADGGSFPVSVRIAARAAWEYERGILARSSICSREVSRRSHAANSDAVACGLARRTGPGGWDIELTEAGRSALNSTWNSVGGRAVPASERLQNKITNWRSAA